jgi:hypothetical protein
MVEFEELETEAYDAAEDMTMDDFAAEDFIAHEMFAELSSNE